MDTASRLSHSQSNSHTAITPTPKTRFSSQLGSWEPEKLRIGSQAAWGARLPCCQHCPALALAPTLAILAPTLAVLAVLAAPAA